ncbi:MAG: prepilin-type N-terminal cleavage/methylation domain-containing protein [Candidatus Omnitrophota bacterium]
MRKKIMGFTLLELVIVIIILGILATLGFAQFQRMVERSRGAEARSVIGTIRTQAAAIYMQNNNSLPAGTLTNAMVGIGNQPGQISDACAAAAPSTQYFFMYGVTNAVLNQVVITATRCTGGNGKQPGGPAATTLILTSNLATGADSWTGTGGY